MTKWTSLSILLSLLPNLADAQCDFDFKVAATSAVLEPYLAEEIAGQFPIPQELPILDINDPTNNQMSLQNVIYSPVIEYSSGLIAEGSTQPLITMRSPIYLRALRNGVEYFAEGNLSWPTEIGITAAGEISVDLSNVPPEQVAITLDTHSSLSEFVDQALGSTGTGAAIEMGFGFGVSILLNQKNITKTVALPLSSLEDHITMTPGGSHLLAVDADPAGTELLIARTTDPSCATNDSVIPSTQRGEPMVGVALPATSLNLMINEQVATVLNDPTVQSQIQEMEAKGITLHSDPIVTLTPNGFIIELLDGTFNVTHREPELAGCRIYFTANAHMDLEVTTTFNPAAEWLETNVIPHISISRTGGDINWWCSFEEYDVALWAAYTFSNEIEDKIDDAFNSARQQFLEEIPGIEEQVETALNEPHKALTTADRLFSPRAFSVGANGVSMYGARVPYDSGVAFEQILFEETQLVQQAGPLTYDITGITDPDGYVDAIIFYFGIPFLQVIGSEMLVAATNGDLGLAGAIHGAYQEVGPVYFPEVNGAPTVGVVDPQTAIKLEAGQVLTTGNELILIQDIDFVKHENYSLPRIETKRVSLVEATAAVYQGHSWGHAYLEEPVAVPTQLGAVLSSSVQPISTGGTVGTMTNTTYAVNEYAVSAVLDIQDPTFTPVSTDIIWRWDGNEIPAPTEADPLLVTMSGAPEVHMLEAQVVKTWSAGATETFLHSRLVTLSGVHTETTYASRDLPVLYEKMRPDLPPCQNLPIDPRVFTDVWMVKDRPQLFHFTFAGRMTPGAWSVAINGMPFAVREISRGVLAAEIPAGSITTLTKTRTLPTMTLFDPANRTAKSWTVQMVEDPTLKR